MARVLLDNVSKTYPDGFQAVKNFNLDIADREFVVFVGPSGCGKSTTLRMIAGLEEISGGTLRIGDKVANDVPPKDRDIAMVFQNYALYPHMTVAENMAFGLSLRKVPRATIDEKVRTAAQMLGLTAMLERKPKALSGGQRQRVAVGRAIVRDPKCFLFDEPLSNLDARLRVEMRAEIKKLHLSLHSTTIYVTHDQEEAMTLGDRVVVMKDGVIQQCDTPLNVYRHPANRFVAGFLGTPPMNFLEAKVAGEAGSLWLEVLGGARLRVPDWAAAALIGRVGQACVVGVRPQALSDRPFEGAAGATGTTLEARVQIVEHLGDKMDVVFQVGTSSGDHVAHLDANQGITPGQTLTLHVDLGRLHVFESEEPGRAIAQNPAV